MAAKYVYCQYCDQITEATDSPVCGFCGRPALGVKIGYLPDQQPCSACDAMAFHDGDGGYQCPSCGEYFNLIDQIDPDEDHVF